MDTWSGPSDDVLVVGAGPVGLTAACQLARLGVPVRVVETQPRPTTESRAVVVHARSLEMLASLGLVPRLEALGRRVGAMTMVSGTTGRTRARVDFSGTPTRHPYMLDIAQPDTEAVLAARAAELGVVVERGTTVTGLTQHADGVEVTVTGHDGERTARAGWVVGADGGHSTVRHLLDTRLEGGFHGQSSAMADVDVDTPLSRDTTRMFFHPDGLAMLFPMAGDRARLLFVVDPPAPGSALTLEHVQALADARMGGRVTVRNPRWLAYFEVHHAQVPRYRHGRVLLAGDAAHVHSPAGGQGMNTGMQDADNLAWKLALVAGGRAGQELLDTYHDERHPVGAAVVRETTALTDVATAGGPEGVLRTLALAVVGHVHRVGAAAGTTMAELAVRYRDSALSVHHGTHHRGAARAGDHAPDPVGLVRADGTPVAVEDLLARPGLLLLVESADPGTVDQLRRVLGDLGTVVEIADTPAGADDVADPDGVVRRAYGFAREGLALVRPDGYLGLVADTADPRLLRRYLDETLRLTRHAAV